MKCQNWRTLQSREEWELQTWKIYQALRHGPVSQHLHLGRRHHDRHAHRGRAEDRGEGPGGGISQVRLTELSLYLRMLHRSSQIKPSWLWNCLASVLPDQAAAVGGPTQTHIIPVQTKLQSWDWNRILCAAAGSRHCAVNYLNNSRTPVAIIFGWGGSSHKNVSKYSAIYHRAGCITVQYVLATR